MYRLALRITQSTAEAEDVVQDVVIKLWHERDNLERVDNIEAYAIRMVRNTALSRNRLKVNQTESLDHVTDHPLTNDNDDNTDERLDSIRLIMQQLPENQRTAMQLRDFEGYSYKEISNIMQTTEEQVKINIFRARQTVKARLTAK